MGWRERNAAQTGGIEALGLLVLALLVTGAEGCTSSFWGCEATATCRRIDTDGGEGTSGEGGAGGAGTGEGGDAGGSDLVCPVDPMDGEVADRCGVWVSAALGDDDNPGTQEEPVRTLTRGIELANPENAGPGRLYACGGADAEYVEWVVLPSGISLFGGFECLHGWRFVGSDRRAVLHAPAASPVLTLAEGEKESLIRDVKVWAEDAVEPGGSSIAVMALPGSRATFRRVELVAGDAADGLDGEDGTHNGVPAQQGLPGNNGTDACTADPGLGGAAVITQCDGAPSIGGQGGDGNAVAASDGLDGLPADPNLPGYGAGGPGEDDAQGTVCKPGIGGAHGKDGQHGAGGYSVGKLTSDGYFGASGGDGEPGQPGQGGGGGGASLGASCAAAPYGGAGGGSGGSGGCGGKGGKGGQAGGSSIGIALLSNGIFADDITIRAGNGGNGGNGGVMQQGGQGGLPGYGGLGFGGAGGVKNACGGGLGGHGGNGGNGGGGHGGHSAAVAQVSGVLLKLGRPLMLEFGQEGAGGKGGDPTAAVGIGFPGTVTPTLLLQAD